MAIFEQHYTLEQAREHLPELRIQLARAQALIGILNAGRVESEKVEMLIRSNGHGAKHPDYGPQIAELQLIVQSINDRGIEIKSLEEGLIDFPHWRDGKEVFLCWLLGEDDIRYWHTLEEGFQGRSPL